MRTITASLRAGFFLHSTLQSNYIFVRKGGKIMRNENKHPKTIEQLQEELKNAEEKRARLLKDRDTTQHKLVIRDKRVTLAYQEIRRFDEDKNRPKECDDYREKLIRNYQQRTEDSKATYYKLESIYKELRRTKSQIRQIKVEIKRLTRKNSLEP